MYLPHVFAFTEHFDTGNRKDSPLPLHTLESITLKEPEFSESRVIHAALRILKLHFKAMLDAFSRPVRIGGVKGCRKASRYKHNELVQDLPLPALKTTYVNTSSRFSG